MKWLVFDLDGTLLDTIYDIANSMNHALIKHNLNTNSIDDYRNYVGNGMFELVRKSIHKDDEELLELVLNDYKEHYNLNCCDKTNYFPGILKSIDKLKKLGYHLAVISNKPHNQTEMILKKYFDGYFEYFAGAKSDVLPKPNPQALNLFAQKFSLTKDDIIYIGDSCVDANFAINFGCQYFLFEYGYANKKELHQYKPTKFLNSLEEIFNYLKK